MTRLTLKAVNKALAEAGAAETLVQAKDYFYFADGEAERWPETMVVVCRLNDLTLTEWIARWKALKAQYEATK